MFINDFQYERGYQFIVYIFYVCSPINPRQIKKFWQSKGVSKEIALIE